MDLSDEQKDRRRQLLDGHALFAQLSMLIPLLIIQLSFVSKNLVAGLETSRIAKVKKERGSPLPWNPQSRKIASILAIPRTVAWWLDGPIVMGWGSKREWIIAGLWASWLLILALRDTGDGMRAF